MTRKAIVVGLLVGLALLVGTRVIRAQSTREEALTRGVDLPALFGIGLSLYTLEQKYAVDTLSLGVPGVDPAVGRNLDVKNNTAAVHLTADYWILTLEGGFGGRTSALAQLAYRCPAERP